MQRESLEMPDRQCKQQQCPRWDLVLEKSKATDFCEPERRTRGVRMKVEMC